MGFMLPFAGNFFVFVGNSLPDPGIFMIFAVCNYERPIGKSRDFYGMTNKCSA